MFKNQDNQNNICFIRTESGYEQITYAELCKRRNTNEEYKSKKFLPLHGMLMEVTEEQYKEFYRQKRRQKYIDERSAEKSKIETTDDSIKEMTAIMQGLKNHPVEYNDLVVRQLIECIKVISKDTLHIYFKDGIKIETKM